MKQFPFGKKLSFSSVTPGHCAQLDLEARPTGASRSTAHGSRCWTSRGIASVSMPSFVLWEHGRRDKQKQPQRSAQTVRRVLLSASEPLRFGGRDGTHSDASHPVRALWGHATVPQDALRPPPGRTGPPILLPLPALQLPREGHEPLAPLLTESVQEARSAVS